MKWSTKILGGLVLALSFLGAYALVSTILDRTPPVIFAKAIALTPEVPQGGTLDVQYTIVRSDQCNATASRFITDSDGTIHVPSAYTVGLRSLVDGTSAEGRETYTRSITVPLSASIGAASYDVRFQYWCNLWQRLGLPIKVEAPTVSFLVTRAPATLLPLTPELQAPELEGAEPQNETNPE